ncbi:MAG: CPBP family intramembrane glutamic endopeptidase [Acidobacteriaceae bacterium]
MLQPEQQPTNHLEAPPPALDATPHPTAPEPRSPLGPLTHLVLYALLVATAWFIEQVVLSQWLQHLSTTVDGVLRLTPYLAVAAFNLAALFAITLFMAMLEDRGVGDYGLGGFHALRRFFTGAAWGILAISTLILTLHSLHLLVFQARLDRGPSILGWGLAQLSLFLLVGIFEEYFFRGYLQFTLTRALTRTFARTNVLLSPTRARTIAFWIAALITSTFFLYAHSRNPGEDPVGLLLIFLAGTVFVLALWRTGSLWWAIGFHAAWDWSQSFLFGVPDSGGLIQGRLFATHTAGNPLLSGGTAGPEGSLLCIPIFLLVILILFFYTQPKLRHLDRSEA